MVHFIQPTVRPGRTWSGLRQSDSSGEVHVPFTGSHPAAVLPLLRLGLPASALVIGSVAPDLPYYFDLPLTAAQTHSLTGVLGANLILGVCAYLLWHLLLVPPLIWAAPANLQRRIPDRLRAGPRLSTAGDLARVSLALAIGALTHVLWDAFTHAGMLGPRMMPWLDSVVHGLQLFRWLHVVSSIIGLACLVWVAVRWWPGAPTIGSIAPIRPAVRWGLALALLGWAFLATAQLAATRVLAPGRVGRQVLLIDSVVEFLSTVALGLICAAVVWHVVEAVRTDRERERDRDRVTTRSA